MLRSEVQVILVALLSSGLLVSGAPRRDMQTGRPRAELTNDKALAHLLLLQFVSELMATRVEQMLPKLEQEEQEGRRRRGGGGGRGDGRKSGADAAAPSPLSKGTQSRLPQLLLEDVHLVLTPREELE
ncbi:unnamed protein product [Pleuronectes platessa]|uniref:Uncharacterized protein n=1 Tax=Pleuronectes platessa TaxID=8262 RepID=A0A9N7YA37_PLEPL|nr:unnamed protein product [Pleuronectes platessa]